MRPLALTTLFCFSTLLWNAPAQAQENDASTDLAQRLVTALCQPDTNSAGPATVDNLAIAESLVAALDARLTETEVTIANNVSEQLNTFRAETNERMADFEARLSELESRLAGPPVEELPPSNEHEAPTVVVTPPASNSNLSTAGTTRGRVVVHCGSCGCQPCQCSNWCEQRQQFVWFPRLRWGYLFPRLNGICRPRWQ